MDRFRARRRFVDHASVVWILAVLVNVAGAILFFSWVSSQWGEGLARLVLPTLACFGMMLAIMRAVPAVERYWGVKPTSFVRDHPYRVYLWVLVYLVVGIVIFSITAVDRFGEDRSFSQALLRYFGGWFGEYYFGGRGDIPHYFNIAHFGYVDVESNLRLNIVFFPLFPWLLRTGYLVIRNYAVVGMIISIASTLGSAVMLYSMVNSRAGHGEAARAVKYLLLFPFAFYLFTPMTEALFLFLTISVFYWMKRKDYFLVFIMALGAGLTRSLGVVLVAPIIIEAGRMLLHKKDKRSAIQLAICALAPLLAMGIYLLINYNVYGNPFQFITFQRDHWHQRLDFFWNTALYLPDITWNYLREGHTGWAMGFALPGVISMALVLGLIAYGAKKLPPTYTVYAAGYFIIAFGATWLLSAPRYSLVIFPIAVSMAALTKNKWVDRLVTAMYASGLFVYLYFFIDGSWAIW